MLSSIDEFNSKVIENSESYLRHRYQTYMTAPEWRNVEMSEEFAQFLDQNKPFYRYPYFKQVFEFWKVFYHAVSISLRHHSFKEVFFSEYMLMNLFIGINSSIEFLAKGCASLVLWPLLRSENNTAFQGHVARCFQDYANFIHTIPFYNFSYFSHLGSLFKNFWRSEGKTLADVVTLAMVTVDFFAHGVISAPVAYWYNQEANQAPESTQVIVSIRDEKDLKAKLKQLKMCQAIDFVEALPDQPLIQRDAKDPSIQYACVKVARYERFKESVELLKSEGFQICRIAGHEKVQVKFLQTGDVDEQSLPEKLYSYQNHVNKGHTFFCSDIEVSRLSDVIAATKQCENLSIKLIHDF